MEENKILSPAFKAKVSGINMITIPIDVRKEFGIKIGDELILEYQGKVDKKEKIIWRKDKK